MQRQLPGSIVESFVLAIELVGSEVKKSPDTIAKILKNPEVEKEDQGRWKPPWRAADHIGR